MPEYSGVWDESRVKEFLRESTIPVRLSFISADEEPWMLSLWYTYDEGVIYCATKKEANVIEHLTERPYCAFEVSTNEPPYRGVRGKGTVTISPDDNLLLLKELVERYVGNGDESFRDWLLGRDVQEVQIAIEPEKIYSWDYSDRMKGIAE
jgi:nitroimidazol reductase NimA-like FMN-containing flavoprotein (pyridoxamine 5'-phosphate oxidase superfamily)